MNNLSDHSNPYGQSQSILSFTSENKIEINEDILREIFGHPELQNRKIVVFSIIGAYRKGKSFFLDYCLRFLYANYSSINHPNNSTSNPKNWMGDKSDPLQGFSWRSGSARDTTGIIIWNDVFLHTIAETDEKIAIVVIDTQGLFDNETTAMDNSRIFALGTLISSIQILNLSGVLQEDQLQYLQFATEFAKFAKIDNKNSEKPFQNLMFLIRDWAHADENDYGMEGGNEYLKQFLDTRSDQNEELKSVRQFIHSSFEELSCALLPYPGDAVFGSKKKKNTKKYNGNWGEMDEDFKDELFNLIEHLLKPDRLVLKKINGNDLTGSEFLEYVLQYFKLFQSDKLPQAQSIYESTVEKQMNILVGICVDNYKETIYKNQDLIIDINEINKCFLLLPLLHNMSKCQALLLFNESKKMGNSDHEIKFKDILNVQIDKIYQEWEAQMKDNMTKIEHEKQKTQKALDEKKKLEIEKIINEKVNAEKLVELEKLKAEKALESERMLRTKQVEAVKIEVEQERQRKLEADRKADEAMKKLSEVETETEEWRQKYEATTKSKGCNIL
ncbi:atlastin-like [Chironomus tepperi]|uniref:atlastin-like n=1 Tax=Chironomus tepperi TaxID=113505 RepID=UPI00391EE6B1